MFKYFKNLELKTILLKIVIVQILFILSIFFIIKINIKNEIQGIYKVKAQVVGEIVNLHPDKEIEIVQSISSEFNENSIELGKEILNRYGYDENISKEYDNIIRNTNLRLIIMLFTSIVSMFIITIIIIMYEMKKVYKKVEKAYNYTNNVLQGDVIQELDYEGEGEFPILANEINKMVKVVNKNIEREEKEKYFLKEMLTDISHQLKTPLTAITMITDILLAKDNLKVERRKDFLENIYIQCGKMEWLIYSLLKIARLEAGNIEFQFESRKVRDILGQVLRSLDIKIKEKEITVSINSVEGNLICDNEWIGEAFTNLVKNAVEHSDIDGEINIEIEESNLFTRVYIRDKGEGIEKKDLPNIFKRFYKGKSSRKTDSIGVGLAMSKSIIEKNNGYITVRSEIGKGTEFEVTFLKELRS